VSAAPDAKKGIDLAWSAPASNGGSAITGYQIYRGTSAGAETLLTTVAASARSYHDQATIRNRRYYYVVRAVNAVGTGPPSSEVSAIAR
jgi:titin